MEELKNTAEELVWEVDNESPWSMAGLLNDYADVVSVIQGDAVVSGAPEDMERVDALIFECNQILETL